MSDKTIPLGKREFKRILLIKLSALGDVVHTTALLAALRRRYPDARIDWLLKPSLAELIKPHPDVTNVVAYGESHTEAPRYNWDGVKHWFALMGDKRFLGMLMGLRRARYDLVIDVHCQMRTAFVTLVTGAPIRIGFGKPQTEIWQAAGKSLPPGTIERSWKGAREGSWLVYTHHIPLPTLDEHAVDRYLSVGRMLDIPDAPANTHLPVPAAATARVNELLQAQCLSPDKAPIVLAPAALWETKQWKPQGFVEVARHFVAAGYPVVLIGSKDERAVCREIAAKAPGTIDLAGRTSLVELAALLQRAVLCLTNDSGPMHMAVALDRPVVSVFGPTNPTWIGPYRKPEAVIRSNRPCVPCNIRWLERCPHGHACMDDVTPAQVIARMERELTIALRHS